MADTPSARSERESEGMVTAQGWTPYAIPPEAVQAAEKALWDKRSLLPEHSEEIIRDVLEAALPFMRFAPLGDNHHNAAACPYCTPREG